MLFEEQKSMLYSDTLLPDVFISEYLPNMEGDFVKIYIYWVFLSRYNRKASFDDMARTLDIDSKRLEAALDWFMQNGLISRGEKGLQINDLKEREIHRHYSTKSLTDDSSSENIPVENSKRISVVRTINNKFFQGVMSISWYNNIDEWFELYKFDEDVMYSLFHHCFQKKVLNNKNYIVKVAENWFRKGIRNIFQLDEYMKEYERMKKVCTKIAGKLKLGRILTVYEEELTEKWVSEFGYDFEIIELALKLTTNQNSPNFKYLDAIITRWHEKGLNKKEDISAAIDEYNRFKKADKSKNTQDLTVHGQAVPQKTNYQQRDYGDEFFNDMYYKAKDAGDNSSNNDTSDSNDNNNSNGSNDNNESSESVKRRGIF